MLLCYRALPQPSNIWILQLNRNVCVCVCVCVCGLRQERSLLKQKPSLPYICFSECCVMSLPITHYMCFANFVQNWKGGKRWTNWVGGQLETEASSSDPDGFKRTRKVKRNKRSGLTMHVGSQRASYLSFCIYIYFDRWGWGPSVHLRLQFQVLECFEQYASNHANNWRTLHYWVLGL